MKHPKKWRKAKRIAAFLFKDVSGRKAHRLVMELEDGKLGGGWCQNAVRDRVFDILTGK